MQENRSFDSYFGTYPDADGIPKNVCLPDSSIHSCMGPYHDHSEFNYGGPHSWEDALADIDAGKMDKFIIQELRARAKACGDLDPKCVPGVRNDVMGWPA